MKGKKEGEWKVVVPRKIDKGGTYQVSKSWMLCDAEMPGFTDSEMRFMTVYLALIYPGDAKTARQCFTLGTYADIMDLAEVSPRDIVRTLRGLVSKPVTVRAEDGSAKSFPLFGEANLCRTEDGYWAVEVRASDLAMPYVFMLKDKWQYIKYSLWNAAHLGSKNQMRLYEWLLRNDYACSRGGKVVTLAELKAALDIRPDAYPDYKIFKRDVLEACRAAMAERTDISFTYEPHRRLGRGKVHSLIIRTVKDPARPCIVEQKEKGLAEALEAAYVPPHILDARKAADDAELLLEFEDMRILQAQHDISDPYVFVKNGQWTLDTYQLYMLWDASGREFGPTDLRALRNTVQDRWAGFDYEPNEAVLAVNGHDAAQAVLMARHFRHWHMQLQKAEADGNIRSSKFGLYNKMLESRGSFPRVRRGTYVNPYLK